MCALDQIVTQQRLFREASVKDAIERRNVIDGLAVENRFAKKILLRIRNCRAVGIGALRIRENPCKSRRYSSGQGNAHARLNDREPALPNPKAGVDSDSVERVRDGFNQAYGCAGRQLRVRIKSNCVANAVVQSAFKKD